MQRPQGISAHAEDAPEDRDAGVRLSAALNRLAALRATIHGDWSDGPTSLPAWGNADTACGDDLHWTVAVANAPAAPELDTRGAPAPEPLPLRGRFESATEDCVAVDRSWIDLVEVAAVDAPLSGAPVADPLPAVAIPAVFEPECGEAAVLRAFDEDVAVRPSAPETAPEAAVVEIDDVDPVFAIGAAPGLLQQLAAPEAPITVAPAPSEARDEAEAETIAYGAVAGLCRFIVVMDEPAPTRLVAAQTPALDEAVEVIAVGAAAGVLALTAPISIECPVTPIANAPAESEVKDAPALAVGAFALQFVTLEEAAAQASPAVATVPFEEVDDDIFAIGAAGDLCALLDLVPAFERPVLITRAFDPMSLIDDALADAFEALVCVADPVDPLDPVWAPDATPVETDNANRLAACETALWGLPRHVPCIETFLLNPNHETAVRLTRALRLRADALQARAFAEGAGFGCLQGADDANTLWFATDALGDAADADALDDVSLADWQVNDAGLVVVTAPAIAPPRRPAPLITEDELDALFAHVDESQSRVMLDDLGEDPAWNETFWHDVDAYLEHVSREMDPGVVDERPPQACEFHDLEVRSTEPEPAPTNTFFWMPGDEDELAVDGDGADLFIVGADEMPAVVLVEDGATYAMRTGKDARMDEIVVSLSTDAWRDIDAMAWRRIAVLSGVAQVRVAQNEALTRRAVVAGAFFATALDEAGVRLVLSGPDGDIDYPVIRVGGPAQDDWASLDMHAA